MSAVMFAARSAARVHHPRVGAVDRHRMIGRRRIELRARRKALLAHARREDARAPDPRAGGHARGLLADPLLNLRDRRQPGERLLRLGRRDHQRVDVAVDQARDDGAAPRVHDARRLAHPPASASCSTRRRISSLRADGGEPSVPNRDRFSDTAARIERDHLGIDDGRDCAWPRRRLRRWLRHRRWFQHRMRVRLPRRRHRWRRTGR